MLPRDLQPASFRGVRFLVPNDTAEEGRNAIRHAYPDSSMHYLEDNGRHPPEFKVSAILAGANLPAQWARLRSALSRPGPGLLKHPWYGNEFVQVDGKFRVRRDDRDAGTLEIEIPFSVTGPAALPGVLTGVAAYVTSLSSRALDALFASFSSRYGVPATPGGITAVAEAVATIADALDDAFGSSGTSGADMARRAPAYVVAPERIAVAMRAAINDAIIDDQSYSQDDLVSGFASVFDTAAFVLSEAAEKPRNTLDRIARFESISVLSSHAMVAAFVAMADAMASATYATAEDVDTAESRLTDAFESIQSTDIDASVYDVVSDVYVATSTILSEVAVRRPRLSTVSLTTPLPASILSYGLYGSDEAEWSIVSLNLSQPPVLMAGSVAVLTEAS